MTKTSGATHVQDRNDAAAVDVSIVVVGYGAPRWLDRCLGSLAGEGRPVLTHEVVLVDNASIPALRETLTADLERVRLVELEENVGFGRACNLGASLARGERVLFLNPDTEALPGAVDALAAFLDEDPSRGLVGGRTLTPDLAPDPASVWGAPTLWSQACFATGLSTVLAGTRVFDPESLGWWGYDTVREVGVVTGCLLMVRHETFEALGGFDESFFMYGEDVDLSVRARAAGYRPTFTPTAAVVHAKGATSSSAAKVLMVMRGKATLYRRGASAPVWRLSRALLTLGVALRALRERAGGSGDRAWRTAFAQRSSWLAGWDVVPRPPLTVVSDSGPANRLATAPTTDPASGVVIDVTDRDPAVR